MHTLTHGFVSQDSGSQTFVFRGEIRGSCGPQVVEVEEGEQGAVVSRGGTLKIICEDVQMYCIRMRAIILFELLAFAG